MNRDYRVAELLYAVSQGDVESVSGYIAAGVDVNSAGTCVLLLLIFFSF